MTNSIIVDTDILIDAGRNVIEAVNCFQNLKANSSLAISIVTQMELIVGCASDCSYSNSGELLVYHKKPTRLQVYSRFKPIVISVSRTSNTTLYRTNGSSTNT